MNVREKSLENGLQELEPGGTSKKNSGEVVSGKENQILGM